MPLGLVCIPRAIKLMGNCPMRGVSGQLDSFGMPSYTHTHSLKHPYTHTHTDSHAPAFSGSCDAVGLGLDSSGSCDPVGLGFDSSCSEACG